MEPHTHIHTHTQMLDRDLEEAEEQYGMAVRAHMMVLGTLGILVFPPGACVSISLSSVCWWGTGGS